MTQAIKDIAQAVQAGLRPVITFRDPGVADLEAYPEANIRARIIGVAQLSDELVRLTFDFTEFDEYNKAFESANYFDDNRVPRLTARQKGKYKLQDTYTFGANESAKRYFTVQEDAATQLMAEFRATGRFETTYVDWLEEQVLALRSTAKG